MSACLNFVRHSFEYAFLFFLNFPAYQCFLVIREETGPYQVLAGTVHAFAGVVRFLIFPVRGHEQGIHGKETTPFLLARVAELTGGDSLESNIQLVLNNARVAAKTAVALCK